MKRLIIGTLLTALGAVLTAGAQTYRLSGPTPMLSNTWKFAGGSAFNAATNAKPMVPIKLGGGCGLMVQAMQGATGVGSTNELHIGCSPDGTYWSTDHRLKVCWTNEAANDVKVIITNIPASALDNIRYLRVDGIQANSTNRYYITNVWVFYKY